MCNLFLADEINRTSPKTQSTLLEVMEDDMEQIRAVMSAQELSGLREKVEETYISDPVYTYIARLMQVTRDNPYIELGVSPRGTIACAKMAKAWAFLQGRLYVTPEDVEIYVRNTGASTGENFICMDCRYPGKER